MTCGYQRRHEILEDLFIVYVALPVYQAAFGRKAPTYKNLTAHRKRRSEEIGTMDPETVAKWRKILEGLP